MPFVPGGLIEPDLWPMWRRHEFAPAVVGDVAAAAEQAASPLVSEVESPVEAGVNEPLKSSGPAEVAEMSPDPVDPLSPVSAPTSEKQRYSLPVLDNDTGLFLKKVLSCGCIKKCARVGVYTSA